MLVLSRKTGERIQIGDSITITIGRLNSQTVKIGIEAPTDMLIVRSELVSSDLSPPQAEPVPLTV